MVVRTTDQRRKDALELFRSEVDLWVASANARAEAFLVPLSFSWTGSAIVLAAPEASLTCKNLKRAGRARVGIGPTRNVVIVEGPVHFHHPDSDPELAAAHAAAVGFDPRQPPGEFTMIHLTPERILAWRNPAELPDRDITGDRRWLS